jgi:hypothetical protein
MNKVVIVDRGALLADEKLTSNSNITSLAKTLKYDLTNQLRNQRAPVAMKL